MLTLARYSATYRILTAVKRSIASETSLHVAYSFIGVVSGVPALAINGHQIVTGSPATTDPPTFSHQYGSRRWADGALES
jgi:hypothetical protein